MQQRSSNSNTTMENNNSNSNESSPPPPSSRSRVLVRSHAMREEPSPPREPTPNHLVSPCIKLTPSPDLSPTCTSPCSGHPKVVLSPSRSCNNSPNTQFSSSQCASPIQQQQAENVDIETNSPKYLNKMNNKQKECKSTSHTVNINNNINMKKSLCDCQNRNCIKCIKNHEKNINNNVTNINNNVVGSPNMLSVQRASSRGKLRQQSSSQGSFESASNSPCLSRDSSSEQYTDTTGIDLELFIPETLNRNAKDRALMLRIEQELVSLAKDRIKTHYKFPPMSSYQRMLVHRCAAYFGMDHNIESSGKCVVVNKTKSTRIPDVEFKEHIKEDIVFSDEPRRSILKRDSNSTEDYNFKSPDRAFSMENRRSKSFEEREEEYEKVRRRIFNNKEMQDGSTDDLGWSEIPWSSTESDYPTRLKPPDCHRRQTKLIKVQSEETGETLRPCVAKSYSFGGYGGVSVLNRGDSVMSTHSAGPRLLTKQDSAASSVSWRLSPSSSGYKSQSQMSESVTPSPTSTPHPINDKNDDGQKNIGDNHIVWAVTDIQNVPKGSIIINPQTGKPIKNDDGTLYHYDPNNPPIGFIPTKQPTMPEHRSSPKKRTTKPPSPNKKLTNSSTSPIMPYSPPIQTQQRCYQYITNTNDNINNVTQQQQSQQQQQQQQFPVYNSGYQGPPPPQSAAPPPPQLPDANIQVYQQPYIVYSAPFGVQQFDGRLELPPPEMANTFYVPEPATAAPPPANASYWGQQQPMTFYQSPTPTTQQRGFSGYATYPQNYLQPANAPPQNDLVPTYPNQSVQIMYPNPPPANPPSNAIVYQNQPPVFYTQNPVYATNTIYQPQLQQNLPPYPTTPTPNSCTSSTMSTNLYGSQIIEPPTAQQQQQSNMVQQLTHSMHQMNISTTNHQHHQMLNYNKAQMYETRTKTNNNKAAKSKSFLMSSSQSSTGTNSPATTIVAGYCPQNLMYNSRTPPETPPCQYNYAQNFSSATPMVFRQISNVRTSTPATTRSSRSPTPASDISRFERLSLPPNLYQGMPYVLHQSDARLVSGRSQPSAYRQNSMKQQQNFHQGTENRNKGRKSKGNKPTGLPPSGKQI